MLPPSLRAHTITVEPLQSDGRYGPTYDPAVSIPGVWVESGRKMVAAASGEEIASSARIWLDPTARQITPGDRITLPNGHQGVAITVDPFETPGDLGHVEVALS